MSEAGAIFSQQETVQQVPTNVVLPVIFREKLRYLARTTRVPQAEFIREAIRDLLDKYQDVLEEAPGEVTES